MTAGADAVLALRPINRPSLVVWPSDFLCYWRDQRLILTPSHFVVLAFMARRQHAVTTRGQILELARDGLEIDERSVDSIIRRIRKTCRIAEDRAGLEPFLIPDEEGPGERVKRAPLQTIYGMGWRWHDVPQAGADVALMPGTDGVYALPPWEQEVVFRTRADEKAFQIATALGMPLPQIMKVQSKARSLGIALTEPPSPSLTKGAA